MRFSATFYRKVAYALVATVLLLAISFLARPRSMDPNTKSMSQGGLISQLRNKYDLSQASLSAVDPTSEVMKLGSMGLHGIAVNVLWNQANEYQDKKAFDKVSATLDTLILLQPNFISVWEFQGHNLAYNISREFDDYEDRYFWIKEGLNFFMKGIAFNKRDHRIYDNLGLHTGIKLGKSDEKKQFRELFRNDQTYMTNQVSQFVDTDMMNRRANEGYDNWLWAYQWYDKSYYMREVLRVPKRTSDIMYWMKRESQVRNYAEALAEDFRPGDSSQQAWKDAFEAWLIYGNREIETSFGEVITYESLQVQRDQVKSIQDRMDLLVPGIREQLRQAKIEKLNDEELRIFTIPADQRLFPEVMEMGLINPKISVDEREIAAVVPEDKQGQAQELLREMADSQFRLAQIENYRTTINYEFWRNCTQMESTTAAVNARQTFFDANVLGRKGIFESYQEEVAADDGTVSMVKREGAIALLFRSFGFWADALEAYPFLRENESTMLDEIMEDIARYRGYVETIGMEWPDNFPLQDLIDDRARLFGDINLPTSADIKARKMELGIPTQGTDSSDDQKESSDATTLEAQGTSDEKAIAVEKSLDTEVKSDAAEPASTESKVEGSADSPPQPKVKGEL